MGELSNTAKGRWVAAAAVGIVTLTWMWVAGASAASGVLAAGILIGGPYALVAGTVVGAIAGRLDRHRELVLVILGLSSALALDALPPALMAGDRWWHDPMMVTLFVLSLVPTIGCALWLERWTRPRAQLAPAIARGPRTR
ncbi:MAG: hypothetical protein ACM31C_16915 [Acidobacteriota bacterium]